MVELSLLILGAVLLTIFIAYGIRNRTKNTKEFTELSFKDSLALTGLPIIVIEEKSLGNINLLVDSGSSHSIINKGVIENLYDMKLAVLPNNTIHGINGSNNDYCGSITLELKNSKYLEHTFQIVDIQEMVTSMKQENGVTLHGILGSDFFSSYNSIIDYKLLKIYNTK